jgi:hypothetical protein
MPDSRPLTLRVANQGDFAIAFCVLGLLALFAALLSPWPVLMSIVMILLFGAGWGAYILGIFKINRKKWTLLVFPDGQLRLESNGKDSVGGVFEGQQWCTHSFAILRIRVGGTTRKLLILSTQQSDDDFRRLNMWLRQDFCSGNRGNRVSDV